MTDLEIDEWLSTLCKQADGQFTLCETDGERAAVVTDLLEHRFGDKMSEDDRGTCFRALVMLGKPYFKDRKVRSDKGMGPQPHHMLQANNV